MKIRLFAFALILGTLAGCSGGYNGQLLGTQDRPGWNNVIPYGMVYVPSGTLHIGQSDQDLNNAMVQKSKSISIQGFYMDATEITNNEYRQFVYWVRDSITAKTLGADFLNTDDNGNESVNWEVMDEFDYNSEDYAQDLEQLYVPEGEQFWGRKEWDVSNLDFEYYWIDWKEAAKLVNKGKPRSEYIRTGGPVNVYPDTLVWVRDFSYSYNEPMTRNYFWHPAFDDYPVVGVNWHQAVAFGAWRTKFWNDYHMANDMVINDDFRLPTESEWEYAARGGRKNAQYPWGGPYTRNSKGCILANFKPGRGNYPEDGGFYTVRSDAYWPNDYGIYNMAGNVSEWTSSYYHENSYGFFHDMNPDIRYDADPNDPIAKKRKVIRGGSWKDVAYFLQVSTRHWEYQDTAKSYVGFRNVLTFLGRSIND